MLNIGFRIQLWLPKKLQNTRPCKIPKHRTHHRRWLLVVHVSPPRVSCQLKKFGAVVRYSTMADLNREYVCFLGQSLCEKCIQVCLFISQVFQSSSLTQFMCGHTRHACVANLWDISRIAIRFSSTNATLHRSKCHKTPPQIHTLGLINLLNENCRSFLHSNARAFDC